ncbi:hypothetical protein ACFQ60_13640 [Streptomyces zhihengii]
MPEPTGKATRSSWVPAAMSRSTAAFGARSTTRSPMPVALAAEEDARVVCSPSAALTQRCSSDVSDLTRYPVAVAPVSLKPAGNGDTPSSAVARAPASAGAATADTGTRPGPGRSCRRLRA